MKKYILGIILCGFGWLNMTAQEGLKVEIQIDNYYYDSLLVAYYFADRQLVHDTLVMQADSSFMWSNDTLIDPGMYMLVTLPEKQFTQVLMPADDQQFELSFDAVKFDETKFSGSQENQLFNDYVRFLNNQNSAADQIEEKMSALSDDDEQKTVMANELKEVDKKVEEYINDVVAKHPESISALIMSASQRVEFPQFEGTEEEQRISRYLYYKSHYFDHVNTKHPAIVHTPFLNQRIAYYLERLTPQHPDSLIESVDYVLSLLDHGSKAYRFYLSTFLNEYANSKIVGFDKVYVHLADNYYSEEQTPWVNKETLYKIKDNAKSLKPVLLGEIGADLQLYKEDGSSFLISELDYEYLVLIFWAPDCGHCNKSMPKYVEFEKEFRDQGVKVLAVCSKLKEKTASCWEVLEEKGMVHFINAVDENHRSRFKIKYNVRTTPKLFVLDPDRKILMKNIGADQLTEVMKNVIEVDKNQKALEDN